MSKRQSRRTSVQSKRQSRRTFVQPLGLPEGEKAVAVGSTRHQFPVPPSLSTLHRWCARGINGCRLEHIRIGKRWYTSHEAVDRFIAAMQMTEHERAESELINDGC